MTSATIEAKVRGASTAVAAAKWLAAWKPRKRVSLSKWSEENARLDSGKRFRAFPFQRGIMDAFSDPVTTQVTVKKASRVGYSQIVQNYVAYRIAERPGRMLIYQPTIDDAEKYSRDDLEPVLDWPAIRAVATFKPRHRDNQVRAKRFRGGWVQIKGANSPKEFRRVTADDVLLEEPDGYPFSAGQEGDPARLAFKRNLTSDEPLSAAGSTPTIKGISRIEELFERGTQEHRYVPCPHCGTMQVLVFGDGSGAGLRWEPRQAPTRAWYRCVEGCDIDEAEKAGMDERGEWRAHAQENGPRHRSFHIWAAYSQFPGAAWLNLAREFLEVRHNPNLLKTFVNQVLGETWAERGEAPDWQRLYDRRENDLELGTSPGWTGVLVASVDVQRGGGGRLEMDVWAFGPNGWRALVDHVEVEGTIAEKETWAKLDAAVAKSWPTGDGRSLRLTRVGVDSGDGENTMHVYAWCRRHPGFAMALKGRDTIASGQIIAGPKWVEATIGGRKLKQGVRLWTVNTSALKLELYGQLQIERPVDGETHAPGYVFLPQGASDEWVKQLVAEQRVMIKKRNGRVAYEWQQVRARNEALDNSVYARAVAVSLGIDRWSPRKWAELVEPAVRRAPRGEDSASEQDSVPTGPTSKARRVNGVTGRARGSFLQRR